MPRDTRRDALLTRRAALLAAGQGVLGAALVARLYQLQILDSDRYALYDAHLASVPKDAAAARALLASEAAACHNNVIVSFH